jgi:glutaredoxin 3
MTLDLIRFNPRAGTLVSAFGLLCLLGLACGSPSSSTNSEQPGRAANKAPQPIAVSANSTDLVFRYLSEDGTSVMTAQRVEDIPATSRKEVVVMDLKNMPPSGWDFVLDATQPLPQQVEPMRGFHFQTVARMRPAQDTPDPDPTAAYIRRVGQDSDVDTAAPAPVKEASNKTVSMFSSPGCPYCDQARSYFDRHKVSFSEYDLERDRRRASKKLSELARSAGVNPKTLSGVPIIFVGQHVIRGFDRRQLSQLLGI